MKANDLIYAPRLEQPFRCRVPLKDTSQVFLVDGTVQGAGHPLAFRLEDGQQQERMLQVIAVRTAGGPRDLAFGESYRFGRGSSGKIILCAHTFSSDVFHTEEEVEISLAEDASAEFVVMQNEHNLAEHETAFRIRLSAGASLKMVFLSLHGGVIRNRITAEMAGGHAFCDLSGLYLTDGDQRMDYDIRMTHLVPDCHSTQLFKSILDNRGVAHFDGLVKVVPDAQRTEAYQANHNLLLSDQARAYTRPQLEIYADDVKCSHGATIGRLNADELFYLRSRGIPVAEARLLQQMAFAAEVVEKISSRELRERMQSLVEKRLRGEFSRCQNCSKNCC
ncbi:MAG: SufD family Fe-S cluster assembly protein [Bacteroidales bacterium]|nr:SufD family Fe-S cluster assembly protein [Bacteroidales bacterium]